MVDQANEDRDAVGYVQSNCSDGCCGCEGNRRAERGEGEAEGEEGGKPDGTDWGAEAIIDFVEEIWLDHG